MFPNPWATTSVPPPVVPKPIISYENNTQPYPFYAVPNTLQNMTVNQQNSVTLNAASVMTQALQSNGIDPTMVQKWQEWKQWELWQQQFQQWQQQTGQMTTVTTQPALPPNPPFQPSQPSTISFQNQQYPCNQPVPPLPLTIQPQVNIKNEGLKRGLEPELQNNEKKKKIDTVNNKKEIELNDETEALFEEQFKSWEEQFFKWKEQNKNHPDKTQYIEYEKKWLSWRDHLKQKCEVLKKKRELKMAEKKKEISQIEENVLQSQQRTNYNSLMSNVNTLTNESTLQHLPNSSIIQSTPENHIPGLDLISNNENINKGFLNVSRILPQNLNMPIQTPDDKPFNFPRNMNPVTLNPQPTNIAPSNINQPSTSMYQNSSSWSKYNNPISCYSQKPPDVENVSVTKFDQQIDINTRPPFSGETSNITYNNSQNTTNTNYRRPSDVSYITPSNETSNIYNKPTDDLSYNRNFNTLSNNFHGYNQSNTNSSNFNNFERPEEKSNISYQQSKPSLNTLPSKPPSLLSLNIVKPISLDKSGNYMENKNIAPNRYEKNWNIVDEEDDPENEYMEAHKKFSSEPLDNHNEDQFSDKQQHRNIYNESYYSRGQQNTRKLNEDYRSLNQSRGSQMMRNSNNDYIRPNSQFSRNINQNYPRDTQTSKNKEDEYYTSQNNRNMDQGFPRRASFSKDVNEEYSNETIIERDNFVQQKGNYGPPLRGNYESCRGNFGNMNKRNIEWDNDYTKNSGIQQSINVTADSPPIKKPVEASPIDPVKIFDYRHLPTLKVIPGLSKETVIPIKVYDYKHGGKRILPWQDRGFSRRNSKYPRDLNETEGSYQDKNDHIIKNNETLPKKLELSSNSMSSDKKDTNFIKNDINETNKETSITLDTITIIDDEDIEEKPQTIEIIDTCAPSPPMMSKIKEIEKSSNRQLLTIETLLCLPGRLNRPSKIVLILRGLPGSGKSYVAKLIKEKEVAMGGAAPRILSLDDYFMTEITKTEIDPETNKKVEKKVMEYEHDSANESLYRTSFVKAFKKKMLENYFSFYIIDAINNKVSYYKDIINISRMNGFAVYIVELEVDVDLCIKRNIHNRTAHDINSLMRSWNKTPDDQILLDIRSLLLSPSKSELNMEDISDVSDVEMELDKNEDIVDSSKLKEENENIEFEEEDVMKLLSCKWTDSIPQEEKMKRLDGLCKKKTENSIKEWLQIPEDNYTINDQVIVKDGKKRVRWADMEERREQEKMRAIGFVVGQTNWDRMLGRDQGESKLTQTKYI